MQIVDYFSIVPFDPIIVNEFLRTQPAIKFIEKYKINSKSLKNPILRTDLMKDSQLNVFHEIGLLGLICVPLVVDDVYWGTLVVGTKQIPKGGFSEVDIRTIKTVTNLLCSFLIKLRMEQLLKEKDLSFRTLIDDHAQEYAFRVNIAKFEITYASKAFSKMIGLFQNEIIGRRLETIFVESSEYLSELYQLLEELIPQEPTTQRVFTMKNQGQIEKHQQVIRGIFDESTKELIEIQCVGRQM